MLDRPRRWRRKGLPGTWRDRGSLDKGAITLRAFITGIAGFAGSHLADYLLANTDLEVCGASLPAGGTHNVAHILDRIELRLVDLNVYENTLELLRTLRPDYVFHLAAQASVERSWTDPAETLINNITAQLNLLRAIVDLGLNPRILIVGSADEYGLVQEADLPVDEDTSFRPMNPYAVSKITQEYLGYQYYLSHDLQVVRVRPFNHTGPRQGPGFVVPDFARQIARIESGMQEAVMRVGNLAARRDISDVRDVVRAYYLALTQGEPGQVYNIGSAQAFSISEILKMLLLLSERPIDVESEPSLFRPIDVPRLVCDCRRFQDSTGWEPEYDLRHTLCDVLDYWRQRVRSE